ncbi:MAG: hypothetical protein PVJ03_08260, partial [Chromatiaceae bacterium]
ATVKRDLVLLGHIFEFARKEWGIYVHNPVRDIKLPPGGRPAMAAVESSGSHLKARKICRPYKSLDGDSHCLHLPSVASIPVTVEAHTNFVFDEDSWR